MVDIREQIAEKLYKQRWYEGQSSWENSLLKDLFRNYARQILNIKCSRGGGVCPECKGNKKVSKENGRDAAGDVYTEIIDCPTCKGTGQKPIETKTVNEILEEWENEHKGLQTTPL